MQDMTLIDVVILASIALSLWAGHYTPWWKLPGLHDEDGKLKRVPSYIYGVLCILAGFAVYASVNPDDTIMQALVFLSLDVVAAGGATMLAYVFDGINDGEKERARRRELEAEAKPPAS